MSSRAIIIEDEALAARQLLSLIGKVAPQLEVSSIIDNTEDAVRFLRNQSCDLIFLDIHLGDDMSFSIFEKCEVKAPVIFTTAYDQYALKAFRVNSLDYLLKPIKEEELREAIHRWQQRSSQVPIDLAALKQAMEAPVYRKRILLSLGQQIRSANIEEVMCFYADQRYTSVLLEDGKTLLASETLEELEQTLDPKHFFRVNRKAIIAHSAIRSLTRYSRSRTKIELKHKLDFDLIVSVERAHDFLVWLDR